MSQQSQTHKDQSQQSSIHCRRKHKPKYSPFKKLAGVVAAIILVLGYANLASAAFWSSAQSDRLAADGTGHNSHFEDNQPHPFRKATVTPVPAVDASIAAEDVPVSSPPESPDVPEAISISVPVESPTAVVTSTSTISFEQDIKYVVIITIDGMRPDGMEQADTPTLDRLKAVGAYSLKAQTINPAYTLPSHVSMLSGVVPQKHGIVEALPCIGCRLTIGPTVFSAAHDAGYRTGMVFGKEKLNYLALENSVDELFGIDAHDPEIKDEAIEIIEAGLPNVLFIHFPDTDRVGHHCGWMSPNYFYAINYADSLIGEIVATLEREGYLGNTLLIITADHGGHDFEHGLDCPEDRTIPWLAVGPGVPQGATLDSQINTYDTAATALYALDVPIPERWDGQPVLEIFE
jgi:hypothetical protein